LKSLGSSDSDEEERTVRYHKVHLATGGTTIDIYVDYFPWVYRKVIIKVNGEVQAWFAIKHAYSSHTFTVPKPGLREPGAEEDIYLVEVNIEDWKDIFELPDKFHFKIHKNGRVLHSG